MTLSYFAKEICSKELLELIDDFLLIYSEKSFSLLDFDSKKQLASIAMKNMGKSAYECLVESKSFNDIIHEINMSLDSDRYNPLFSIHEAIVDYLNNPLEEIFQERISEIEVQSFKDAGLKPYQHKDNGEIQWRLPA